MSHTTTSSSARVIRVRWGSRFAGFDNSNLETIVQKACTHFRLGPVEHEFMLIGYVNGIELEFTDDMLKRLPDGEIVTLARIPDATPVVHDLETHWQPSFSIEYHAHSEAGVDPSGPPSYHSLPSPSIAEVETTRADRSPSISGRIARILKPSRDHNSSSMSSGTSMHSIPPHLESPTSPIVAVPPESPRGNGMLIYVKSQRNGVTYTVEASASHTISEVVKKVHQLGGPLPRLQRLVFDGRILDPTRTVRDYGIQEAGTVTLLDMGEIVIRKPVIYLFPSRPLDDVKVSVCLVPQWPFSHIYPLADVKTLEDGKQSVQWTVSAAQDGTLVEKSSHLEVSYLFWEAHTDPAIPPSPPSSPVLDSAPMPLSLSVSESFDPAHPTLEPDSPTVVLLPFATLLPYLDRVLAALSLHTAARTDFITYWLPALSRHPYLALRFLPQIAYARAAALDVEPTPDVVTRVFMLFRGVSAEEAVSEMWRGPRERADTVDWVSVVGVKREAARNASLFRVLEWGGMEVASLD